MGGSRFLKAIYLLRSVVLFQYVPRFFRTYSLVTSGAFGEPAKARAMFSPLLFVLGIHGIGGLWYFLSIERLAQCWNKACENHVGCFNLFRCKDNNIGEHTFLNDFCPRDAHKTEFFDFGMFSNAVESRVVETTDFPKKLLYCLHWGLLSLSCFGQNIQTGTYVWENVFTIFIIIFGLLLFLMLLGNLQAYLQSRSVRKEETRRQAREMEHWMPFKLVPEHLKSEVWSYLRYNWLESIGDDMEKFLANLPVGLTDRIKSELYLKLVKRVPMFDKMDESLLKALCDRLKTVFYSRERYIILEGEAITEMVFINQGTVLSVATKGGRTGFFNSVLLKYGDFFGEELVFWALDPGTYSRLPFSTRTFRALEEVTAFTLKAEDMKVVASYFVRLHGKEFIHIFRFYSQQWRTWAACFIQAAWRRYQKRKLEASLQQEENRLQDALAKLGGNSPSLGATIYASRFTANALGAIRRNSYRKARMLERTPLILLQKPAQPDFAGHEQ